MFVSVAAAFASVVPAPAAACAALLTAPDEPLDEHDALDDSADLAAWEKEEAAREAAALLAPHRDFAARLQAALAAGRAAELRPLLASRVAVRGEPIHTLDLGPASESRFQEVSAEQLATAYEVLAGRVGRDRWRALILAATFALKIHQLPDEWSDRAAFERARLEAMFSLPESARPGDVLVEFDLGAALPGRANEVRFVLRDEAGQTRVIGHHATYHGAFSAPWCRLVAGILPNWVLWLCSLMGVVVVPHATFWSLRLLRTGRVAYSRGLYGKTHVDRVQGVLAAGETRGAFAYLMGLLLLIPLAAALTLAPWGVAHLWLHGVDEPSYYPAVLSQPFFGWMAAQAIVMGLERAFT